MEHAKAREIANHGLMIKTMYTKTEQLKGSSYRRSAETRHSLYLKKSPALRLSKQFATKKTNKRLYGEKYFPSLETIPEVDEKNMENQELGEDGKAGPSPRRKIILAAGEYQFRNETFGNARTTLNTISEEDEYEMKSEIVDVDVDGILKRQIKEIWEIRKKDKYQKMEFDEPRFKMSLNAIPEENVNEVKKEDVGIKEVDDKKEGYGGRKKGVSLDQGQGGYGVRKEGVSLHEGQRCCGIRQNYGISVLKLGLEMMDERKESYGSRNTGVGLDQVDKEKEGYWIRNEEVGFKQESYGFRSMQAELEQVDEVDGKNEWKEGMQENIWTCYLNTSKKYDDNVRQVKKQEVYIERGKAVLTNFKGKQGVRGEKVEEEEVSMQWVHEENICVDKGTAGTEEVVSTTWRNVAAEDGEEFQGVVEATSL